MEEIWTHCRRFTRYQDRRGNWSFFRFYAGDCLWAYLDGRRNDLPVLWEWFRHHIEVDAFILDAGHIAISLQLDQCAPAPESLVPAVSIDERDRVVFRVHALDIEAEKFSKELRAEFGRELANLPEPAVTTIVAKSLIRMSSYGFTRRNDLRALATWEVFYGVGFERKDPQGVLQSICMSDKPAPERFRLFSKRMRELAPLFVKA